MKLDRVYTVRAPSGWGTAFGAFLINDDFSRWVAGEGVFEIRSTTVLRLPGGHWERIASARTKSDAEATLATIIDQASLPSSNSQEGKTT